MRGTDRSKYANRVRYESQRLRIVLITMGCFLMTMTFILSTKPGSVFIENVNVDETESWPSPSNSKSNDVDLRINTQIKEDFQSSSVESKIKIPKKTTNFGSVDVDIESRVIQNKEDQLQWEKARTEFKPIDKTKIFGDADSEAQFNIQGDDKPKRDTEEIVVPEAVEYNHQLEITTVSKPVQQIASKSFELQLMGPKRGKPGPGITITSLKIQKQSRIRRGNDEHEKVVEEDPEQNINLLKALTDDTNAEKKLEFIVSENEETTEKNTEDDKTQPSKVPTLLDRFNENLLEIKPIVSDQFDNNVEKKDINIEKADAIEATIPKLFERLNENPAQAKQNESVQSDHSEKSVNQWFVTNPHIGAETLSTIQIEENNSTLECDFTDFRSDTCNLQGDVRIHANSSTIYFVDPTGATNKFYNIKPYPRKGDEMCNRRVVEFNVTARKEAPQCTKSSDVTAIVFSIGGYTGNIFHDFSDVIMPLFTASHPLNGKVQFLMTNTQTWWLIKYDKILKALSHYEPIRLDSDEANDEVHCFKHVIVGLVAHRELIIEPLRNPNHYSTQDFTRFIRQIFPLERDAPIRLGEVATKKPRMLIISRARSRMITNLHQVVGLGQELGFEVIVQETDVGSDLIQFAQVINSCDVMIGVHGAGLTNEMFLPPNGTLIQIVPYGGLDWIGQMDYGDPAIAMGLNYIQYSIVLEESSLLEKYGRDNEMLKNPFEFHKRGFGFIHEFFMNGQNVTLNLDRFKDVLITTLDKLTY